MKNPALIIPLAALLFVFPWLAATLIANLDLVPAPSSVVQSPPTAPSGGGGIAVQASMVQGTGSYGIITAVGIAASLGTILVWRLWRGRRKDDFIWQTERPTLSPLVPLALFGLMATTVYGLLAVSSDIPPTLVGGGGTIDLGAVLPYLVFGALLVSSVIAIALFSSAGRVQESRRGAPSSSGEVDREKVADILNETAYALQTGSDNRTAILNCYAAICRILDGGSAEDSSKLTAREFEYLVSQNLNLGRAYLHEATLLFEKARYSAEEMDEEDVKRSRFCLRRLGEQVRVSISETLAGT